MFYSKFNYSSFSNVEKKAIFKIALELVKADHRIHSKEILLLDKLRSELSLNQDELDLIHYIPLSESISAIKSMDSKNVNLLLELFNDIIRTDSDISLEENLLLTAISMSCGKNSRNWSHVISTKDIGVSIPVNQIIYLEKSFSKEPHNTLDDRYDNLLLSKALGDIGFKFFYLPCVLQDMGLDQSAHDLSENGFSLLKKSLPYIMPAGDRTKVDNLASELVAFDTSVFFKVVMSRLNLEPDLIPYEAFLLVKIGNSIILDDNSSTENAVDFLCINLDKDVKKRIFDFVSHFDKEKNMIPYDGYYKLLYDHFSIESKINSDIVIDLSYNFCLENLDNQKVLFESAPQSKTFYLLLLKAGKLGIRQQVFVDAIDYLKNIDLSIYLSDGVLDIMKMKDTLRDLNTEWSILIFNTITIYQTFSTKNEQMVGYITYILSILSHRSSLKNYVNNAFSSLNNLYNPKQYYIQYNKEFGTYYTEASLSLFFMEETIGNIKELTKSFLWMSLL